MKFLLYEMLAPSNAMSAALLPLLNAKCRFRISINKYISATALYTRLSVLDCQIYGFTQTMIVIGYLRISRLQFKHNDEGNF